MYLGEKVGIGWSPSWESIGSWETMLKGQGFDFQMEEGIPWFVKNGSHGFWIEENP